jgi:hypothetical protein
VAASDLRNVDLRALRVLAERNVIDGAFCRILLTAYKRIGSNQNAMEALNQRILDVPDRLGKLSDVTRDLGVGQ